MTTHGSFRAQLRLPFNPEKQLLEAFAAGDAGAVVEETTTGWQLQHSLGRIALKPQSSNMDILLDAKDRTSLAYLQLGITHRLQSLDKNLDLDWQSDNTPGMLLPYFREMRVVSAENLTPFMKRVRLAGKTLRVSHVAAFICGFCFLPPAPPALHGPASERTVKRSGPTTRTGRSPASTRSGQSTWTGDMSMSIWSSMKAMPIRALVGPRRRNRATLSA